MSKVPSTRALARARLLPQAVNLAITDVFRMDWEIIDDVPGVCPFRIVPGKAAARYVSGIRILYLEDHARHFVLDALSKQVARVRSQTFQQLCKTSPAAVSHTDQLLLVKMFAMRTLRNAFTRDGNAGLTRLIEQAADTPANKWGTVQQIVSLPAFDPTTLHEGVLLAKGLIGELAPSRSALAKAALYFKSCSWTLVRGEKAPWVVKPGRIFSGYVSGENAKTETAIARTVIARAIKRLVPRSRDAINRHMRFIGDQDGVGAVKADLCNTIAEVVRLNGLHGLEEFVKPAHSRPLPLEIAVAG